MLQGQEHLDDLQYLNSSCKVVLFLTQIFGELRVMIAYHLVLIAILGDTRVTKTVADDCETGLSSHSEYLDL